MKIVYLYFIITLSGAWAWVRFLSRIYQNSYVHVGQEQMEVLNPIYMAPNMSALTTWGLVNGTQHMI